MPQPTLDEKIKRIKMEAMFSILILGISLFLVFTWMGSISMSSSSMMAAPSMAGDAYRDIGRVAQVPEAETSSFVFVIGVIISVIFFLALAAALNYHKREARQDQDQHL